MFGVAYLWVRLLAKGLHADRRLRFSWVAVGDRLSEEFRLVNHSPLPALWVEIVDESNVPGYRAGIVRSVGYNNVDSWRQAAICQQRGQFRLGPGPSAAAIRLEFSPSSAATPPAKKSSSIPRCMAICPFLCPPGRAADGCERGSAVGKRLSTPPPCAITNPTIRYAGFIGPPAPAATGFLCANLIWMRPGIFGF